MKRAKYEKKEKIKEKRNCMKNPSVLEFSVFRGRQMKHNWNSDFYGNNWYYQCLIVRILMNFTYACC